MHFSEDAITNATSESFHNGRWSRVGLTYGLTSATTPWIALVACDSNATHASQENDIFTLARDRGAVGAVSPLSFVRSLSFDVSRSQLLYSMYSEACIINPEYANPQNFDQVMDIFSTQSLSSARQAPSPRRSA